MTAPSSLTRVAGAPLVAVGLCVVYAAVVLAWLADELPWWLALCAVIAAAQTVKSAGYVRRYKTWAAEWQAMGEPLNAPSKPLKPQTRRKRTWPLVIALVVLVVVPASLQQLPDSEAGMLMCLWLADCLFLACRLFGWLWRALRRSSTRPTALRQAKVEDAPVAWLLPRASDSPSRETAQRNLPEYAARLIGKA